MPKIIYPRLPVHITLFSRASCALCITARESIEKAWRLRPFEFVEIDVMGKGQQRWKDVYEFDVPVIHVARTVGGRGGGVSEEVKKLMHSFTAEEIVKAWDDARSQGEGEATWKMNRLLRSW